MVTLKYRPNGTGVAGHIQPSFEFRWNYAEFGALPDIPGYDSTYPCALSDHVFWFTRQSEFKHLEVFYQGQEEWAYRRHTDLPPTNGNGWCLFEFWTRDLEGVEDCLNALVADLRGHNVPIEIVRSDRLAVPT